MKLIFQVRIIKKMSKQTQSEKETTLFFYKFLKFFNNESSIISVIKFLFGFL